MIDFETAIKYALVAGLMFGFFGGVAFTHFADKILQIISSGGTK